MEDIGFRKIIFSDFTWINVMVFIVTGVMIILLGYQVLFGIIKTGIAGMFFAMLYISTNSIVPGIVLHFFMDFSSAFILKEENIG